MGLITRFLRFRPVNTFSTISVFLTSKGLMAFKSSCTISDADKFSVLKTNLLSLTIEKEIQLNQKPMLKVMENHIIHFEDMSFVNKKLLLLNYNKHIHLKKSGVKPILVKGSILGIGKQITHQHATRA